MNERIVRSGRYECKPGAFGLPTRQDPPPPPGLAEGDAAVVGRGLAGFEEFAALRREALA